MADVWDFAEDQKIRVHVNANGQPVGDETGTLKEFIGTMVRMAHLAPINRESWFYMPLVNKEEMWKIIEAKFTFDPFLPTIKKHVVGIMGEKWRQWKNKTKKWFDESKTEDENIKQLHETRVDKEQFQFQIRYWKSEKAKIVENNGQTLSRAEIYIRRTHTDGSAVSEKAAQNMNY